MISFPISFFMFMIVILSDLGHKFKLLSNFCAKTPTFHHIPMVAVESGRLRAGGGVAARQGVISGVNVHRGGFAPACRADQNDARVGGPIWSFLGKVLL
jgi:hypothetical protein